MASSWRVLSKDNACLIKELDRSVKNGNGIGWNMKQAAQYVLGFYQKIPQPRKAICRYEMLEQFFGEAVEHHTGGGPRSCARWLLAPPPTSSILWVSKNSFLEHSHAQHEFPLTST